MKRIVFISVLFLIGWVNTSHAQLLDSLQAVIKSKSSIDIRLESRYSFINNDLAGITEIRIGAAFRRKLRLGGGLSCLNTEVTTAEVSKDNFNNSISNIKYLKMGYVCVYADFVFYKTKRWQLSVPIQTGFGLSWLQTKSVYDLNSQPKYFFMIYEPGIATQFKIFKCLGLGVDVNYRFAVKNNKTINGQLSSPTYAFKLLFWIDQLYFDLFPNSGITKKYGPAIW